MREIKFRAWDTWHKYMDYIDDLYWFEEEGVHDSKGEGMTGKYILMQFTGLKDKNGKEIYEGDIVKNEFGNAMKVICYINKDSAEWCGNVYKFENGGFIMGWFKASESEVIGNIYENPELLKENG